MKTEKAQAIKYFEYMQLAREAFVGLCEKYPEFANLSVRELEIFEQLMTDKTLAAIADKLCITQSAVHFHCKNIYKKLDISNRRQLLIKYKELYT